MQHTASLCQLVSAVLDWGDCVRYPCLIDKRFCKTAVNVEIAPEGTDRGEPLPLVTWSGNANYQDKAKTILTAEKKLIQLTGCALIPGDIAPDLPTLSGGTVTVNGVKRRLYEGAKVRNPDGTVNHTRLDVV